MSSISAQVEMESTDETQLIFGRLESEVVQLLPYDIDMSKPAIDSVPHIRGWPESPQLLEKPSQSVATVVWDIMLCIIPLLCTALGVICIRLHHTPISDLGGKVQRITLLLPTIFPIIFAATVGSLLRRASLWRIEKGASIALLEQLQGSVTFVSTLQAMWLLRSFKLLSLMLALLWAFSPLGGQAGLRILNTSSKALQSTFDIFYIGPQAESFFDSASSTDSLISPTNSIFTASLLAGPKVQTSLVDSWGNVKIPFFEMLNTSTADNQGWISTAQDNVTFTSLVGVPMTGLSSFDNANYTMNASYYFMKCPQAKSMPTGLYFTRPDGSLESHSTYSEEYQTLNFSTVPSEKRFGNFSSFNITLASINNDSTAAVSNCTLDASTVEVNVSCSQMSCGVVYIRRSLSFPWSGVSYGINAGQVIGQLLQYLPSASGLPQHVVTSSLIEAFLTGTDITLQSGEGFNWVDLTLVPSNDLSIRLTQVFNTYYSVSISPFDFINSASLLKDFSYNPNDTAVISYPGLGKSTGIGIDHQKIYIIETSWIVLYFTCTFILLGAAIFNIVLGRLILAPDIIGYASTLTRDNPNIPLPPGGSTLSGMERAYLLKDLRIRLGDERKNENDVGSLGLRSGSEIAYLRKLQKNKLYVYN